MRQIQEEREERHRLKSLMKKDGKDPEIIAKIGNDSPTWNYLMLIRVVSISDESKTPSFGSYDTGDPNTTNIYLGNINPKV